MANITSAAQLVQALDRGQSDVFLSSHIDLRTLQLERSQDDILVLGNQTKSLRGDCGKDSKLVSADAVEQMLSGAELLPGQCVVYGIGRLLSIRATDEAWIESLVLAQEVPTTELNGDVAGAGGRGAYALTAESGLLYLSHVSVISRTGAPISLDTPLIPGFEVGSKVTAAYVQDSRFSGFAPIGGSIVAVRAGTAFHNCTFGPMPAPEVAEEVGTTRERAIGGGVEYAGPPQCLVQVATGGEAQFVESVFNSKGDHLDYNVCRDSDGEDVFADVPQTVGSWRSGESPSLPGSAAPQGLFLTQEDFHEVTGMGGAEGASRSPLPEWTIVLIAVAAACMLCFGMATLFLRRRAAEAASHGKHDSRQNASSSVSKSQGSGCSGMPSEPRLQVTAATLDAPLTTGPQHMYSTHSSAPSPSTHHSAQRSTVLPAESDSTAEYSANDYSTNEYSTNVPSNVTDNEQPRSSMLVSMPVTSTGGHWTTSVGAAVPADMNVNFSSNPPTLSTFPATTKPGQAGSSFQNTGTSHALASTMLRQHDAQRRGASAATDLDSSHTPGGQPPVKQSLVNAGTSFQPSHNELPSSALGDFLETRTAGEQLVQDDCSGAPVASAASAHERATQASHAPLALGGVAHQSVQDSLSGSGAASKPSSGDGSGSGVPSIAPGFQQKMSDQQGPSGPSQASRSGSTGDSKRPQATQHKALKMQPTMQIERDLKAVPPGCTVHGYSLVRDQMLRGGQGVVHFVLDKASRQYAMKLFSSRSAFRAECALYDHEVLCRFLPQRHATISSNQAMAAAAQCGCEAAVAAMQWPCLVLEQGEDLQSICSRALFDIGTCLKELHESNYVHRDIKPSNVIHLPGRQVWRLIDCGLAAKVGAVAPVAFTRPWAPPEAITADMHASQAASSEESYHASLHTVTPALDAWSFGVVAYELVTSPSHIRPAVRGRLPEINAQIVGSGGRELPWEGVNRAAAVEQLGALAEPILGLLQRNPQGRWTLQRFCSAIYPRHAE